MSEDSDKGVAGAQMQAMPANAGTYPQQTDAMKMYDQTNAMIEQQRN